MAATIDTSLILPRYYSIPGAEIINSDGSNAGLRACARVQNTLSDIHRGVLICDAASSQHPILTSLGNIAKYRVPSHRLGLQNALVDIFVDVEITGSGIVSFEVTMPIPGGGTTIVSTVSGAFVGRLRIGAAAMPIDDDSSFIDIDLELGYLISFPDVKVLSFDIKYVKGGAAHEVTSDMQTNEAPFVALSDALTEDEEPLGPGLTYTFTKNARELYSRTGKATVNSFVEHPVGAGDVQYVNVHKPENATYFGMYFDVLPSTLATTFFTIGLNGTQFATTLTGGRQWVGVSWPTDDLSTVSLQYLITGTNALVYGLSTYWTPRNIDVYAVKELVDELDNCIVDEHDNGIRS